MNSKNVVIMGQGYVGLPTAIMCAKAGFTVFGLDKNAKKISLLKKGKSYIDDIPDEELKNALNSKKYIPTTDIKVLKEASVVLICVPTPLDKNKLPDISYITSAGKTIAKYLHKNQLIVLESTTYPGTTEEVLLPMLEKTGLKCGKDFYLAFSPERVDPGNKIAFCDIPRVIGGIDKKCTEVALKFYKQFIKSVFTVSSTRTAEMTKLLENIYRLVNISLINELALVAGKMGIDIWEVIEAAKTKPYGFTPFYPSPKVGGHCIPLDPFYLSWKAREYGFFTHFIDLAGEINDQMPHFVITRVIWALNKFKKATNGAKILIIGIAYKKDISDTRESAVYDIISDLLKKGALVSYHDPYIHELQIKDKKFRSVPLTDKELENTDCVLILTDHSNIDFNRVAKKAKFVIDTRNAIKSRSYKNISWL